MVTPFSIPHQMLCHIMDAESAARETSISTPDCTGRYLKSPLTEGNPNPSALQRQTFQILSEECTFHVYSPHYEPALQHKRSTLFGPHEVTVTTSCPPPPLSESHCTIHDI